VAILHVELQVVDAKLLGPGRVGGELLVLVSAQRVSIEAVIHVYIAADGEFAFGLGWRGGLVFGGGVVHLGIEAGGGQRNKGQQQRQQHCSAGE